MKESKIVVADRGRKHFIVPVSPHHTLQFSNHVFLHILFNGHFSNSFQKFNLHLSNLSTPCVFGKPNLINV